MNFHILAYTIPFENIYSFQMSIEPLIIFVAGIILAVRCWKKSAAYFKVGFIFWLTALFGYALVLICGFQIWSLPEICFMFSVAIWPACGVWFAVWVIGFIASKMFISE